MEVECFISRLLLTPSNIKLFFEQILIWGKNFIWVLEKGPPTKRKPGKKFTKMSFLLFSFRLYLAISPWSPSLNHTMPPNGIRSPWNANLSPASKFRLVSLSAIPNVLNFPNSHSLHFGSSSNYSGFSLVVGPLRRRDFQTRSRLTSVNCGAAATRDAATDHYSTLNVSRNATLQDIKNSYKKLARKVFSVLNSAISIFLIFKGLLGPQWSELDGW